MWWRAREDRADLNAQELISASRTGKRLSGASASKTDSLIVMAEAATIVALLRIPALPFADTRNVLIYDGVD